MEKIPKGSQMEKIVEGSLHRGDCGRMADRENRGRFTLTLNLSYL